MLIEMSLFKRDGSLNQKKFLEYFVTKKLANILPHHDLHAHLPSLKAVRLLGRNHVVSAAKQQSKINKRKLNSAIRQWNVFLAMDDSHANLDLKVNCLTRLIRAINDIPVKTRQLEMLLTHATSLHRLLQTELDIAWFEGEIALEEQIVIDKQQRGRPAYVQCFRIAAFNEKLAHRYEILEQYDMQRTALLTAIEYLRLSGPYGNDVEMKECLKSSLIEVNQKLDAESENRFRMRG